MTPQQTLELRASEIRTRMSEIGGLPGELPLEVRSELDNLRNEYGDNERKQQAMRIAGDAPVKPLETRSDAEGLEFRSVLNRGNVGEMFDDILGKGAYTGANEEIRSHYGIASNQIPLSMLRDNEPLETRAVTPAPAEVGQNAQPIVPYVFPQSVAAFLGVDMPTVPVGEAVFPVLTSTLDVGTPAENAEQAETTGAFSADVLAPSRLQASFFYSREDRARFAGMDMSLRENLSMGLADGLDKQVIQGTNGLLTGTNLANHNVTAVTTYALFREQFAYGRVDGRYAATAGDIRVVMGAATYAHAASQYRGNNDNMDALMSLLQATAGVRVSAHVPAVSGSKQSAIVRLGNARDMVAPIWEGVTLIPDEITQAKKGQIIITAVMLHAVKVLRTDGFYKQQTQHA